MRKQKNSGMQKDQPYYRNKKHIETLQYERDAYLAEMQRLQRGKAELIKWLTEEKDKYLCEVIGIPKDTLSFVAKGIASGKNSMCEEVLKHLGVKDA